MVLSYDYSNQNRWQRANKCTSIAGHFDGHGGAPVPYVAHLPMQHDQGFAGSHWTPPLGDYSLCIAPAATRATANETMLQHVPTLLAISMAVAMRWYDTGSWLSQKPLNATIGQALAPILQNQTHYAGCFGHLIMKKSSS